MPYRGISPEHAAAVRARAELLHGPAEVEAAFDRMAEAISTQLSGSDPVVLCVMNGGVIPAAGLLMRLDFPLRQDYVHATRYRGATAGGELHWVKRHSEPIAGENVLVIDDILDEGLTLEAIVRTCREEQAKRVFSAVLVEKQRPRDSQYRPDFIGLEVENRYVFGYGMDYKGYWRNAAGIYAVAEQQIDRTGQ